MQMVSSIIDSNGVLNADEFNKIFLSGLLKGISMWFDSPLKILLWIVIIVLIILSFKLKASIRRKRMKQMAKYQAEAMNEMEQKIMQKRK